MERQRDQLLISQEDAFDFVCFRMLADCEASPTNSNRVFTKVSQNNCGYDFSKEPTQKLNEAKLTIC